MEDRVERWTGHYPPADISPKEFEEYIAGLFASLPIDIREVQVESHDRVEAPDGTYEFDATARCEWRGLRFLILVEAKRQAAPIKREQVQVLHQKVLSVGAQKGVMFSTSPFQSGALEFAKAHGIALVSVTEGRFTYETRAAQSLALLSREEAAERFDLPTFVGHAYQLADDASVRITLLDAEYPEYVVECLLPVPAEGLTSPP